jgi:hypothetical protein
MTTLNPTLLSFQGQIFPKGLKLEQCSITRTDGTCVADPAAVIRPGQLVSKNASNYLIPANLNGVYGVAKYGKVLYGNSVRVDAPVVLVGTTASSLPRPLVSNVSVRSLPNYGGTLYAAADYTINATNGTIARAGGSSIPDGATVYVTFTFQLTEADFLFDGRLFQQQPADYAAFAFGQINVIVDWAKIFTIEYATGQAIATGGLTYTMNQALYCNAEGQFSNISGGGAEFVGRVTQLPTASFSWMGIVMGGNPTI